MIIGDNYVRTQSIRAMSFIESRPIDGTMKHVPSSIRVEFGEKDWIDIKADKSEYDRVLAFLKNQQT